MAALKAYEGIMLCRKDKWCMLTRQSYKIEVVHLYLKVEFHFDKLQVLCKRERKVKEKKRKYDTRTEGESKRIKSNQVST